MGTSTIAMFSIRELTPVSISRSPYISNIIQMVYRMPRMMPPRRLALLQAASVLKNTAASIRNDNMNLTARMLIGGMFCIRVLEKRKDVPLAIKTAISRSFAFEVFMISVNYMP
jgi:hypothetical protein